MRNLAQRVVILVAICCLAGPAFADDLFVAYLSGDQVTPPTGSPGKGNAFIILHDDHLYMDIQVDYKNLTSEAVGTHVHRLGPNPASPVLFDLGTGDPPLTGTWMFPLPQDVDDLYAGKLYVNVHTVNFHLGEIQGTFHLYTGPSPVENGTWGRVKALFATP